MNTPLSFTGRCILVGRGSFHLHLQGYLIIVTFICSYLQHGGCSPGGPAPPMAVPRRRGCPGPRSMGGKPGLAIVALSSWCQGFSRNTLLRWIRALHAWARGASLPQGAGVGMGQGHPHVPAGTRTPGSSLQTATSHLPAPRGCPKVKPPSMLSTPPGGGLASRGRRGVPVSLLGDTSGWWHWCHPTCDATTSPLLPPPCP